MRHTFEIGRSVYRRLVELCPVLCCAPPCNVCARRCKKNHEPMRPVSIFPIPTVSPHHFQITDSLATSKGVHWRGTGRQAKTGRQRFFAVTTASILHLSRFRARQGKFVLGLSFAVRSVSSEFTGALATQSKPKVDAHVRGMPPKSYEHMATARYTYNNGVSEDVLPCSRVGVEGNIAGNGAKTTWVRVR